MCYPSCPSRTIVYKAMFICDSITWTWRLHSIEDTTLLEALHVQLVTHSTCTYFECCTINRSRFNIQCSSSFCINTLSWCQISGKIQKNFVFTYVFTEKGLCRRLGALSNEVWHPSWEILDLPLNIIHLGHWVKVVIDDRHCTIYRCIGYSYIYHGFVTSVKVFD